SRLVYVRDFNDFNIWRIERAGPADAWEKRIDTALSSTKWDSTPSFSPDGEQIVFQSTRSGAFEIWMASADGTGVHQLTFMGAGDTGTANWSPDGNWITFDSNLEGHFEVYVIPATGGKVRRMTFGTSHSQLPSFSADGKFIFFSSNRSGEF